MATLSAHLPMHCATWRDSPPPRKKKAAKCAAPNGLLRDENISGPGRRNGPRLPPRRPKKALPARTARQTTARTRPRAGRRSAGAHETNRRRGAPECESGAVGGTTFRARHSKANSAGAQTGLSRDRGRRRPTRGKAAWRTYEERFVGAARIGLGRGSARLGEGPVRFAARRGARKPGMFRAGQTKRIGSGARPGRSFGGGRSTRGGPRLRPSVRDPGTGHAAPRFGHARLRRSANWQRPGPRGTVVGRAGPSHEIG